MANNNYASFGYGGAQYNSTGGANYNPGQVSYPAVTNATFANAAAYQSAAVVPGQNNYAAASSAAASGYGGYSDYGRALPYDASKTFYQQQTPSNYNPVPTPTVSKTHYSSPPVKNANAIVAVNKTVATKDKQPNNSAASKITATPVAATTAATVATSPATSSYSNYDAALYSAASIYVAQQQAPIIKTGGNGGGGGNANMWSYRNMKSGQPSGGGGGSPANSGRGRIKQPPRPQQLHYCEVCKISCAGPQTYREHLEGQKHKKRESSLKMQASAQSTSQNRGNNYHCDLCDVTCTGTDAYAAHVRGAKHQKVVKLHQKLGKPIPPDEPKKLAKINFVPESGVTATGGTDCVVSVNKTNNNDEQTPMAEDNKNNMVVAESQNDLMNAPLAENLDNIKPVGGEYIEEIRDEEGKTLSFNCKLCDCKFNDPNAKEMHMKGRRHRLQYKRKVQPDLVVDFKPTPRQRRLAEARAQRALIQSHRNANGVYAEEHDGNGSPLYWDEQRRRVQYDDEYDYNWMARSFGGPQRCFGGRIGGPPPFYGVMPSGNAIRRPESTDDRHAIARHAEIYPKEDELQTIQRIVSHTERALKFVSDELADSSSNNIDSNHLKDKQDNSSSNVKDGRDNQMLSFQKDADAANVRILKGVMRVGFLAKGLLLQGDRDVELVVLCSEKPTIGLLKRVANELPKKLKEVAGENPVEYAVEMSIINSSVVVRDELIAVHISLTSPLLRDVPDSEKGGNNNCYDGVTAATGAPLVSASLTAATTSNDNNTIITSSDSALLPREPCLKALAELRHAKWFQARATGLQSCVMVIRILRDLCQRVSSWQSLPQWSLELLVEKVISSVGFPISPGDCLRRIMEAIASGFLICGPGLLDPCEKDAQDAFRELHKQQREDLTVSAQIFLRLISFRQINVVLGMEQIPAHKFPVRPWRLNRKRRRNSPNRNSTSSIAVGSGGNNEKSNATIEDIGGANGTEDSNGPSNAKAIKTAAL